MAAPVAVILAAGKSTRMKSSVPKVLHEVCGRPMVDYVLDAARAAGAERLVVVVGHKADVVRQAMSRHADVEFAEQTEQLGTGHAVMMAESALTSHEGSVLILAGDTPLLTGDSLKRLLDEQSAQQAACVIGTADTDANEGLGRVVRDANGLFVRIVEQKDATAEEAAITEINTGCYAFDCQSLLSSLKELRPENKQAEYYLTDCPSILQGKGQTVAASCSFDIQEAMGVNTRLQLAEAQQHMQRSTIQRLMHGGVTVVDPNQTWIDVRATIGQDTVIYPFTTISGPAEIGNNCRLGPSAVIQGSAKLEDGSVVGPFEVVS